MELLQIATAQYGAMELLQPATAQFITKCNGFITNCDSLVYYKAQWNYCKLRQLSLLESAME